MRVSCKPLWKSVHGGNTFVSKTCLFKLQQRNGDIFQKFPSDSFPNILQTNNVPIHLYTSEVEEKAMKQVFALANSDIPVGYVSIMPDVHWGKGSVVGAVFACRDKICPMAVVCFMK